MHLVEYHSEGLPKLKKLQNSSVFWFRQERAISQEQNMSLTAEQYPLFNHLKNEKHELTEGSSRISQNAKQL